MRHASGTHLVLPLCLMTGFTGWTLQLADSTAPEDPDFLDKILLATGDALLRESALMVPEKIPWDSRSSPGY
jgi:hypothetical protein